jgi:osmotically inducible protein OsmC
MADIERSAQAVWNGDLRSGKGKLSSASGVLNDAPYSFATRFEQANGTNPEELIGAAHAGCFTMALSAALSREGFKPQQLETRATVSLSPQQPSGFKITKVRLETQGQVTDSDGNAIDDATFQRIATGAKENCPVSTALRGNIEIELDARLV